MTRKPNQPLKLSDIQPNQLEEGHHPFAEVEPTGRDADQHAPSDYTGAYQPSQSPHGEVLLWLAAVAFVFGFAPMLLVTSEDAELSFSLGFLGLLAALTIGFPTFFYAIFEIRGIRLGAIDGRQRYRTMAAFALATLAILISCSLFGWWLVVSG